MAGWAVVDRGPASAGMGADCRTDDLHPQFWPGHWAAGAGLRDSAQRARDGAAALPARPLRRYCGDRPAVAATASDEADESGAYMGLAAGAARSRSGNSVLGSAAGA